MWQQGRLRDVAARPGRLRDMAERQRRLRDAARQVRLSDVAEGNGRLIAGPSRLRDVPARQGRVRAVKTGRVGLERRQQVIK